MWHENFHSLLTVRRDDGGVRERHKNSIRGKKAKQKDSNTCKPRHWQSIFVSRSFWAKCSHDAYMRHADVACACRRIGPQTWRHSDMEAHNHTCMRAYTLHITYSKKLTSCLSFAVPYSWQMLRAMFHGSGAQSGWQSLSKATLKKRCE